MPSPPKADRTAIGATLGPSLGGFLIAGLGWQIIFLVNVPLGVVNLFLVLRALPIDRQAAKRIGQASIAPARCCSP